MTALLLGLILVVLLLIARELRLLRKQRNSVRGESTPKKYKSKIFTFERSGWKSRIVRFDESIPIILSAVIWARFVFPNLPSNPWMKYPISLVGVLIGAFFAEFLVVIFITGPIGSWMEQHDEKVYRRVLTDEEREDIKEGYLSPEHIEELYRHKGL